MRGLQGGEGGCKGSGGAVAGDGEGGVAGYGEGVCRVVKGGLQGWLEEGRTCGGGAKLEGFTTYIRGVNSGGVGGGVGGSSSLCISPA